MWCKYVILSLSVSYIYDDWWDTDDCRCANGTINSDLLGCLINIMNQDWAFLNDEIQKSSLRMIHWHTLDDIFYTLVSIRTNKIHHFLVEQHLPPPDLYIMYGNRKTLERP